ncbi:MAG: hypothetical protein M1816_003864 [Peltula sp. TS41687]|nr:MAG: hypothetical protein M1816_003864 [Peltula sp. TS41687]
MDTYHGHVRTPNDAIILFEACRLGLLPRVQRRLSEKERQSIKSGSVFVWDEREAGMRRWTDGKSWSASRVSGSFLTYREMEGKRGGGGAFSAPVAAARSRAGKTPDSTRGSDSDVEMGDEGPDGYRYKPDGLMKQSFSITTSTGQHLHLISYYSRSHPAAASLMQPSNDPGLRHIRPQKGMYPDSTVHEQQNVPVANRGGPLSSAHYSSVPVPHGPPPTVGPPHVYHPRSGATHPLSYASPSAFGWPPSPVSTPPHPYANGPYGPPAQLPAVNGGSAGASPLQYSAAPAVIPTSAPGYDRPPPLPLSEAGGMVHPPPALLHRRSGSSDSPSSMHRYIPTSSPHTPVAEPAQIPTSAPSLKIDPRLTALSGPTAVVLPPNKSTSSTTTRPMAHSRVGDSGRDSAGGMMMMMMGTGIPSIGTLMMKGPAPAEDGETKMKEQSVSPGGSRSPAAGSMKCGGMPKDIPSEKLRFAGEDARAIRVLDRAFNIA